MKPSSAQRRQLNEALRRKESWTPSPAFGSSTPRQPIEYEVGPYGQCENCGKAPADFKGYLGWRQGSPGPELSPEQLKAGMRPVLSGDTPLCVRCASKSFGLYEGGIFGDCAECGDREQLLRTILNNNGYCAKHSQY